jgi:hypothetical protein
MLIEAATALSRSTRWAGITAAGHLSLAFPPSPLARMLIHSSRTTLRLTASTLQVAALTLRSSLTAGPQTTAGRLTTLPTLAGVLGIASPMLRHFFRNSGWQFGGWISRILAFRFLSKMIAQLLFLFLVFYALPAVIDFVGAGAFGDLGMELRIFVAADARWNQTEIFAIASGEFPAELAGIIVSIDVDSPAFLATELADAGVAPIPVRATTVNAAASPPTNVSGVERVDDQGAIPSAVVNASAAEVRIGTEIANVNKGVTVGPNVTGGVHPRTDSDVPFAPRLWRQRRPTEARFISSLAPRNPRRRPHFTGHPGPTAP